jgi:hypothetical protein
MNSLSTDTFSPVAFSAARATGTSVRPALMVVALVVAPLVWRP